jgi:hypothetical protein
MVTLSVTIAAYCGAVWRRSLSIECCSARHDRSRICPPLPPMPVSFVSGLLKGGLSKAQSIAVSRCRDASVIAFSAIAFSAIAFSLIAFSAIAFSAIAFSAMSGCRDARFFCNRRGAHRLWLCRDTFMMYLPAVQSSLLSLQSQRKQASLASSVFSANKLLPSACSAKKPVFSEIAEKTGFLCNLRGTIPGPPGACVEMRRTRFAGV